MATYYSRSLTSFGRQKVAVLCLVKVVFGLQGLRIVAGLGFKVSGSLGLASFLGGSWRLEAPMAEKLQGLVLYPKGADRNLREGRLPSMILLRFVSTL